MKKIAAILLAVTLMISLVGINALATGSAATLSFKVTNTDSAKTSIYNGDTFTVAVVLNGISTWGGAGVSFSYDNTAIQLQSNTPAKTVCSDAQKYLELPSDIGADYITYTAGLGISNPNTSEAISANFEIVSFTFKALKLGSMGLAFELADTNVFVDLDNQATVTAAPQTLEVKDAPVAPTATALAISETEIRQGGTATATFSYSDANNDPQGAHVYTWYVDGVAVDGAKAATFVPDKAEYVGKVLTFSVVPKSTSNDDPAATEATLTNGLTIKAPSNYKPVVAPTYPAKITVGKAAVVAIAADATYTSEDETVVNWYVVEPGTTEIGEAQEAAFEDSTTATFEKDLKGKFVIIEVIPGAKAAGESFVGDAVYSAPIEIKSSTPKSSGGTTGPGTLLPGVGTEEPGNEEPGNEEPGNEEPTQSADKFTDFSKTKYNWAYDAVDKLVKEGVIEGKDEKTFDPEGTTTNAEFVAMVIRAMGIETEAVASGEHWAKNIIAAAKEKGLLDYTTSFESDGKISREEMFTILYKALLASNKTLEKGEVSEFTDAASISDFAKEATGALIKAGIVNGMGDGTVAPKGTATRAQVATVIFRAFFK